MRPSDDPGHKAAEELLQQKQDSHYGDMAGSKTYRQILIEKYPDRKDEIEAFDYPGLDMLKADDYYNYIKEIPFPGPSWVCLANFLEMILECVKYYQEKLDECEQMYQDDMGVGNYRRRNRSG